MASRCENRRNNQGFNGGNLPQGSIPSSRYSLLSVLGLQLPQLLLNILGLVGGSNTGHKGRRTNAIIAAQLDAFASHVLFFAQTLARDRIKDVGSLRRKSLEVVGHVCGGKVGCAAALRCDGGLLTPAGVHELD